MGNQVFLLNQDELTQIVEEVVRRAVREEMNGGIQKKPEPTIPDYLSRKQAAEYLSVSLGTIDNLSRDGVLKKHYLGAIPRFKREEIFSLKNDGWKKYSR